MTLQEVQELQGVAKEMGFIVNGESNELTDTVTATTYPLTGEQLFVSVRYTVRTRWPKLAEAANAAVTADELIAVYDKGMEIEMNRPMGWCCACGNPTNGCTCNKRSQTRQMMSDMMAEDHDA